MRHPFILLTLAGAAALFLTGCGGTTTSSVVGSSVNTSDPGPSNPIPIVRGTATGTLVDDATGAPIPGAKVRALEIGSATVGSMPLTGTVLASADTDAAGAFTLDGIPVDKPFRLVTMPDRPTAAYDVSASDSLMLTEGFRSIQQALRARTTDQIGGVSLTFPTGTAWNGTLSLYQVVTQPAGQEALLVRRAPAPAGETLVMERLAAGTYYAVLECSRSQAGMAGSLRSTISIEIANGGVVNLERLVQGLLLL